ncbi:MAG: ATP synthase F0 subunit B [Acidobacteriota bacterium]|jgi:F-type H+-transporting ATPase subunit b|nr:ATP synthase F0 subunit B [Acidobacteriota bacterium]
MAFLAFLQVQLMPDFSMFIHMAMILAMIWILNRTFFRPINRILDARVRSQGGQFSEAEGILKETSEKEMEYNASLLQARNEGYELIEKQRTEAMALKQSKIAEVKQEVESRLESELNELEQQTARAKNEISEEAEKMAERISSNILQTT